jgi:hypothetical protein
MKSKYIVSGLVSLVILQLIMVFSLFAKVPPHPPETIPISGIGPLIGVSISLALSAILVGPTKDRVGRVLSVFAVTLALLSYGPQKYFDPQFPLIWPAVICAQIAALVILAGVFNLIKEVARA